MKVNNNYVRKIFVILVALILFLCNSCIDKQKAIDNNKAIIISANFIEKSAINARNKISFRTSDGDLLAISSSNEKVNEILNGLKNSVSNYDAESSKSANEAIAKARNEVDNLNKSITALSKDQTRMLYNSGVLPFK